MVTHEDINIGSDLKSDTSVLCCQNSVAADTRLCRTNRL
jgi:hypothetical protein